QAEDGIRDLTVTGVQTCALPICYILLAVSLEIMQHQRRAVAFRHLAERVVEHVAPSAFRFFADHVRRPLLMASTVAERIAAMQEIGRASCRDRVQMWVVVSGVDG